MTNPATAQAATLAAGDAADEAARVRAETYTLLAALLSAPPDRALLDALKAIEPPVDESAEFESANSADAEAAESAPATAETAAPAAAETADAVWRPLRAAAAQAAPAALEDEYHDLFIGLGRGEVVPFGSWHLTGFLMEQPLSDLRDDLKALGIEADAAQKDPEDHIAALCESMALLIRADDIDEAREKRFFARHIQPWAGKFFAELRAAKSANFYRAVGALGARFVEVEARYLNFPDNSE